MSALAADGTRVMPVVQSPFSPSTRTPSPLPALKLPSADCTDMLTLKTTGSAEATASDPASKAAARPSFCLMFFIGLFGCLDFGCFSRKQIDSIKSRPIPAGILPLILSARMRFNMTVAIGYIDRAQIVSHGMSGKTMCHIRVASAAAGITVIADDWLAGGNYVRRFNRPAVGCVAPARRGRRKYQGDRESGG